jgi:hypothetical protein
VAACALLLEGAAKIPAKTAAVLRGRDEVKRDGLAGLLDCDWLPQVGVFEADEQF